jgi:hypothetical protein
MHACLLDMLHDPGDDDRLAVGKRVDVHFHCVAQVAIDQHRAGTRNRHRGRNIMVELLGPVDDLHPAPAEHVGGTKEHRIADPLRHQQRLVAAASDPVRRLLEIEPRHQLRKPLAVLCQVDAVGAGAQDRNARLLQLLR